MSEARETQLHMSKIKFNVGNIILLRTLERAQKMPKLKLWKSHPDGGDIVAADFEETLDNGTPTEPDHIILIEEHNFTAF